MGELGLRESVLAKIRESKPTFEEHEIPGIGKVYIKRLNAGEKDLYEKLAPGSTMSRALTIVHCCFDERGGRIFADADVDDIALIDPQLIDPIVLAALRVNGYTKDDQEALLKKLERPGRQFLIALARELGKSIAEVEAMDGGEIDEWKAHFAGRPFTIDMLDHVQAWIRHTIAESQSGKRQKIEHFFLIKRPKTAEQKEKAFKAALG